jgi:lipopolysaccharide transport system ATP-binding protein
VAVRAAAVSKQFAGGVWALRDIDFELAAGEALAIVGANGSGKSSLLDLLLGVSRPSAGEVHVAEPVQSLLELGAGMFLELSGRRNAWQMGLLAGLSGSAARRFVEAVGEFAELGEFFDRPVRTYSAGMSMRLGFAVAACGAAQVVLVDEVLAVGDGYFQRKCVDRLRAMRQEGRTLVVASHDLHALEGLCDRGLWLREGRTAELGPVGEVVGRYREWLRQRLVSAEAPPARHGTGDVVICTVRLSDATGRERASFEHGHTLHVEVVFETARPVESPIMGVALFRADGVYCYGPNTKGDASLAGRYEGRYRLVAEFPSIQLLAGEYQASVAFYDADHVYAYAWDHRLYPFRVEGGPGAHGVVALPHRFEVERLGDVP